MPACWIDLSASRAFARSIKAIDKRFPRLQVDLTDAFTEIQKDYTTAAHARPMLGFKGVGGSVWKYRCPSSDQQKGARSGFRIIAFYQPASQTLFPLLLYTKGDKEQLPSKIVEKAIQDLKQTLAKRQQATP